MIERREFITLLGVAAAWPLAARAERGEKIYRIGILEPVPAARNAANLDALRKGLRDFGYFEGRNLAIEYRSANGQAERFPRFDQLPELAADLVRRRVSALH
jgi:putative tryptophan/tyrosine transport system substrate-binding protein